MSIYDRDWYWEDRDEKERRAQQQKTNRQKNNTIKNHKNPDRSDKFGYAVILLFYLYCLYRAFFLSAFISSIEGTGIYPLRLFTHLSEGIDSDYLFNLSTIIGCMIPVGFLYPLYRQKRGVNATMVFGALLGTLCEMLQFSFSRGECSFDDLLFGVFGTWLGYRLFIINCRHSKNGIFYLLTPESKDKKGLLGYLFVVAVLFSFAYNITNGTIITELGDFDATDIVSDPIGKDKDNFVISENIVPSSDKSIYDTIYSELSDYKTTFKITGLARITDSDTVYGEFLKVLDDHPELFWLSGGAEGNSLTSGPMVTYTISPYIIGDISKVPGQYEALETVADKIVAEAKNYDTDYDKALFVHDHIIENCEYDTMTYFNSTYFNKNAKITTHAYDSYGCLVEKCAVCAGYAKAYMLIMNRLGIECGYVTGIGSNSMGSGPHAWNYIKIDGQYYYVDVTWDDPVTLGYYDGTISRDYFLLTKDEIMSDHSFDDGQYVPD